MPSYISTPISRQAAAAGIAGVSSAQRLGHNWQGCDCFAVTHAHAACCHAIGLQVCACCNVQSTPRGGLTDGLIADDRLVVALRVCDALLCVSPVAQRADQLLQQCSNAPLPPGIRVVHCSVLFLSCMYCVAPFLVRIHVHRRLWTQHQAALTCYCGAAVVIACLMTEFLMDLDTAPGAHRHAPLPMHCS